MFVRAYGYVRVSMQQSISTRVLSEVYEGLNYKEFATYPQVLAFRELSLAKLAIHARAAGGALVGH